jgi:DNA-binding transcriptional regulator/RsmH inhibitor MraZ
MVDSIYKQNFNGKERLIEPKKARYKVGSYNNMIIYLEGKSITIRYPADTTTKIKEVISDRR